MANFWLQLNKPILALAPMEGVTDIAFRRLCRSMGADVVYTEFVSSDAIAHRAPRVLAKLDRSDDERPVVAQIFGRDPQAFVAAAKEIEQRGFDGLDINFGCPARKVVGHGSGVALLRDPKYARTLIEAALSATKLPISVKIRASIRRERPSVGGSDTERVTAIDFLDAVKDLPLAAVMVHGRTAEAGHEGDVDHEMIRRVKERFPGIVLANGGIFTAADAVATLQATGADGVGIARGAWGQPWIFRQIRQLLAHEEIMSPTSTELRSVVKDHTANMLAMSGERGIFEFRKHLAKYFSGFAGAAGVRRAAVQVTTQDDIKKLLAGLPA